MINIYIERNKEKKGRSSLEIEKKRTENFS